MSDENEKYFTQTELDQIITDRLARQKRVYEDKLSTIEQDTLAGVEKTRLEEQSKYKELYEKSATELEELPKLRGRVESYEGYFGRVLEKKLKEYGDAAEKATSHLTSAFDKLDWLERNKELFAPQGDGVGTPKPGGKRRREEPKPKFRLPTI